MKIRKRILILVVVVSAIFLYSCPEVETPPYDEVEFTLESSAFSDGGIIPQKYYANGVNAATTIVAAQNISVPLEWEYVPFGTKSFMILIYDTIEYTQQHWFLYNIDSSVSSIDEGINSSYPSSVDVLKGSLHNSSYWGPNPTATTSKTYKFVIIALKNSNISLTTVDSTRISGQAAYQSWGSSSNLGYLMTAYVRNILNSVTYNGTPIEVLGIATLTGIASP